MLLQDLGEIYLYVWPPHKTAVDASAQDASVPKILGASVALNWAWRNRAVGGCQNTAVHHLEVWFCKISVRSNYMCGQRWGLLQQIFISESGKRPVATG